MSLQSALHGVRRFRGPRVSMCAFLLVDRFDAHVAVDSSGNLTGKQLELPEEVIVSQERPRPAALLHMGNPNAAHRGSDLILVSADVGRNLRPFSPSPSERYSLLLAVPQGTIRSAWQGLLPALGVAALIAVPAAVVLGIIVARYITRPLQQLTVASQRMAEGTFDVEVSIERQDEVGRLAQSFSTMADACRRRADRNARPRRQRVARPEDAAHVDPGFRAGPAGRRRRCRVAPHGRA